MLKEKIGVIGAGKIGSALLHRVIRAGLVEKEQMIVSAQRASARKTSAEEIRIRPTADNAEV